MMDENGWSTPYDRAEYLESISEEYFDEVAADDDRAERME